MTALLCLVGGGAAFILGSRILDLAWRRHWQHPGQEWALAAIGVPLCAWGLVAVIVGAALAICAMVHALTS